MLSRLYVLQVAKSMPKPEEMRKRKAEDMVSAYGKKVKSETVSYLL